MRDTYYAIGWIFLLQGFFLSCSSNPDRERDIPKAEGSVRKTDSSALGSKSNFEVILKKYKAISFDTLKVYYTYDEKDTRFSGKELTLKEAKSLPIGITENYFGKFSGVYACYQFPIDSFRVGLITRIPGEYESTSVVLLIFDRKRDKIADNYFYLGTSNGDAGEISNRVSWLYKTKEKQLHSFVYDYQSSHEIDDTVTTESRYYFLVNCMSPQFDTISSNQTRLMKRFKGLLRTEE